MGELKHIPRSWRRIGGAQTGFSSQEPSMQRPLLFLPSPETRGPERCIVLRETTRCTGSIRWTHPTAEPFRPWKPKRPTAGHPVRRNNNLGLTVLRHIRPIIPDRAEPPAYGLSCYRKSQRKTPHNRGYTVLTPHLGRPRDEEAHVDGFCVTFQGNEFPALSAVPHGHLERKTVRFSCEQASAAAPLHHASSNINDVR